MIKKISYQLKKYRATELMNEFPSKWWTEISINRLLKRHRHRLTASGGPRSARPEENVELVNDLGPDFQKILGKILSLA